MKRNILIEIGVLFLLIMITGCAFVDKGRITDIQNGYSSGEMMIAGLKKEDVSLDEFPRRMYVRGYGAVQIGTPIICKLGGLKPGARIYWSYEYIKGPLNTRDSLYINPFFQYTTYLFQRQDNSTIADEKGETAILFIGTSYAGDRFRVGAGSRPGQNNAERFIDAEIKSQPLSVWKRLYLEQPKVLKGVKFPETTWEAVCSNLARLNIEVRIKHPAIELDPLQPGFSSYFSGAKEDYRYGPGLSPDFTAALSNIARRTADIDPETINVIILGAISADYDLIKARALSSSGPPCPANYNYLYRRKNIDRDEFMSHGSALAMLGDCPTIFIWADYWWVYSKLVKVGHDKVLARTILHELGHHLLKSQLGAPGSILDRCGHLSPAVTTDRSIMNGYNVLALSRMGKFCFSWEAISQEKRFIKNPTWHPLEEQLIRQYYIPPQRQEENEKTVPLKNRINK